MFLGPENRHLLQQTLLSIQKSKKWSLYHLKQIQGHQREILCSYFSSPYLFTGGGDHYLSVWHAKSFEKVATLDLSSSDGVFSLLYSEEQDVLLVGTFTGFVNVLRFQNSKLLLQHQMQTYQPAAINCLAIQDDFLALGLSDDTLLVYRLSSVLNNTPVLVQKIERRRVHISSDELSPKSPSLYKYLHLSADLPNLRPKNLGFDSGVRSINIFFKL